MKKMIKSMAVTALALLAFTVGSRAQPFGTPQTLISAEAIEGRNTNSGKWVKFWSPPTAKEMTFQISCKSSNDLGATGKSNLTLVVEQSLDGVLFDPIMPYITALDANSYGTNYVQVTNFTINARSAFRCYVTNGADYNGSGFMGMKTNVTVKVYFK